MDRRLVARERGSIIHCIHKRIYATSSVQNNYAVVALFDFSTLWCQRGYQEDWVTEAQTHPRPSRAVSVHEQLQCSVGLMGSEPE